jgi:hypothetical protein
MEDTTPADPEAEIKRKMHRGFVSDRGKPLSRLMVDS